MRFRAVGLTAAAVLLAACAQAKTTTQGQSPSSPSPSTVASQTTSPTPSESPVTPTPTGAMTEVPPPVLPSVSKVPSGNDPLTDGQYFGYLKALDPSAHTATFDVAQFFSGEAANRAAVEDGAIPEGETVPNDYYIRNASGILRTVPLADTVVVTVARCPTSCGQFAGSLDGLAESFRTLTARPDMSAPYRGPFSQYWLTVSGGKVVRIDEQFLP